MLAEKFGLILLYLGLLALVCALPFIVLLRLRIPFVRLAPALFCAVVATGATALLIARGLPATSSPVLPALVLVIPLVGLGTGAVISGLATLPMLAGAVWWAPDLALTPWRAAFFMALGSTAAWLPRLLPASIDVPRGWAFLALLLSGLASMLLTGVFTTPSAFWVLWHHWGAFVAPVEAMLAGAVPYRDFPVQYGMGPTLLIALLGGGDAWQGTYLAAALTNLLYLLAMGGCVLAVLRGSPRDLALLALAAMICAVLLWTGYPPDYLGPLATPSVGGMRFAPLGLLLLSILRREANGHSPGYLGHAFWLLAVGWSPEAAFYATLVWWPYLAIRRAQTAEGRMQVFLALLWGAARAIIALILAIAGLVLLFHLGFGDWPSVSGFLTYIRSPPGILQPNPTGPVWLILTAVLAGILTLGRSDAREMRIGFLCLSALVAVSSYYLGRSHDNNLLNLFPFVVLAVLPMIRPGMPNAMEGYGRVVMAGLVAWPASFGFSGWSSALERGDVTQFGAVQILDNMRLETPSSQARLDGSMALHGLPAAPMADAGAALEWLRSIESGTPLIVNLAAISVRGVPGLAWTGMTNLATYGLLPPDVIAHFIRRGADVFRRPGWLLVDRAQAGPWLERFGVAYDITETRVFGGYTAYRLVPR